MAKRFIEITVSGQRPTVDYNRGMILGVKLLGRESRNGRRYSQRAMESACRLYVGCKNYVDHDRSLEGHGERGLREWASVVDRAYIKPDGVYGDLQMRQKGPDYEALMEAASKFYRNFGMSHVAEGDSRMEGRVEIVEDITAALSIDFVTNPATTNGLAESASSVSYPGRLSSIGGSDGFHIDTETDNAAAAFHGTVQAELDSIADDAARFRDQVMAAFERAFASSKGGALDHFVGDLTSLCGRLREFIRSDSSGVFNGEQELDQVNHLHAGIADALGNPLVDNSPQLMRRTLSDLVAFVDRLRGRDSGSGHRGDDRVAESESYCQRFKEASKRTSKSLNRPHTQGSYAERFQAAAKQAKTKLHEQRTNRR